MLPSSIFGFVFPDNHFHHPLLYFLFVSQISRACDECRRRKTKCDLVGCFPGEPAFQEAPLEKREQQSSNDWGMIILQPCANCVRSDLQCCYTKRSQKRPGKGYIKELERRLDHLENVALVPSSESPIATTQSSPVSSSEPGAAEDRIARLETVISTSEQKSSKTRDDPVNEIPSDFNKPAPSHSLSSDGQNLKRNREENLVMPSPSTTASLNSTTISHQKLRALESVSSIKSLYLSTFIQATFPVVHFHPVEAARSLVGLDEKPLLRGMKLLLDPIEKPSSPTSFDATRSRSVSRSESPFIFNGMASPASNVVNNSIKSKSHLSKQMNLFAQASRGFSSEFTASASSTSVPNPAQNGTALILAGRRLSNVKAAMEADSLLLCYLDGMRHGQDNNSALAVAVSKLGGRRNLSGDEQDSEPATKRRRTVMMMMDRW